MSKFNFLLQILPLIEQYEAQTQTERMSISSFAAWLPDNLTSNTSKPNTINVDSNELETATSLHLVDLYKYFKHYSKKVLEQTPIRSLEEYGFLHTLLENKSLLKGELIQKNIVELTTGTDVVKRLISNLLIEELPEQYDKRAKRVQISDLGREQMEQIKPVMDQITSLLSAGIPEQDKKQLLILLTCISSFHDQVYQNDRKNEWDTIWQKYNKLML